jgi:hypothetical protein
MFRPKLKTAMRAPSGICKLTGRHGRFVRSHLLPKALTRPSVPGSRFIEGGHSLPPRNKWDSWYDDELVTRDGEDILARYDSWAIQELSRLELLWKSRGPATALAESVVTKSGLPSFGLREVNCENPSRLRLFFLSLLWRAAATKRIEFRDIHLDEDNLDRLRRMVRDGDPSPLEFYPTTLLQIASRGPTHNFVPIAIDSTIDIGDGIKHRDHVFRFYFDGLIARMHRSVESVKGFERFLVGGDSDLVVQMQLFDDSFQFANLKRIVAESAQRWPEASTKITRGTKK